MPPPSIFGPWATEDRLNALQTEFAQAQPFPHIVIDDFFNAELAHALENEFPIQQGESNKEVWQSLGWHVYDNPIEGKLAFDHIQALDECFQTAWNALESPDTVARLRKITGIQDLETDPHVHGAGLHYHPTHGRLELHLDYSIHPISGMERRVNLIVYLNSDWQQEWGGDLQLWEGDAHQPTKLAQRILPLFNRAVLFRTSDISWHGMPDDLQCPHNTGRKSLAIYFVSPPTATEGRPKASFRPHADSPTSENYLELCKIRSERRLTPEDVSQHMPEWTPRWLP